MAKLPDITSLGRRIPQAPRTAIPVDVSGQYRDEAALWATVGQVGSQIGDVYLRRQKETDTYRAEDAYNKLQQKTLELNAEYSQLKSGDVVGKPVYKNYGEKFDQYKTEIEETLDSEEQKKLFQSRAAVAKLRYNNDLLGHITKEKDVFEKQVYVGGIAVEQQNAAAHYSNPASVAASIYRTEKLTEAEADREGWPEDVKKAALSEAKSNIHEAVIRNALAEEQTDYAKGWFKSYKKEILGTKHGELERLIEDVNIRTTTQKAVDEYVLKGLTESEAKSEARKSFTGTERDAAITRIEARYGEKLREGQRVQREAGDQAWQILGETKDLSSIPMRLLQEMDGKERIALEKTAAKSDVVTDLDRYYGIMEIMDKAPEVFRQMNLYAERDKIAKPDLDRFLDWQRDKGKMDIARSKSQVIKESANSIGIDTKEVGKDSTSGKKATQFFDRVDQEVLQFQQDYGKEPNSKELKEITDRLAIKVLRERTILGIPYWSDKETAAVLEEIPGVPKDLIDDYAQALTSVGQPVTPENIQKLHNYQMSR